MPYELCRHVKTNGRRCGSPALTDGMWCYFHHRLLTRHRNLNTPGTGTVPVDLKLPPLEDHESIQVALSLVADAIVTGTLPEKRAAVLLRAIGLASRNAQDINTEPYDVDRIVRAYLLTLDGLSLSTRRMNDNSRPPARPPVPRQANQPEPE